MFDNLENDQTKYIDLFPKTLIDAYNFLSRWNDSTHRHHSDLSNDGVNFTTRADKNNNEEHIITSEKGETVLATKGKETNKTKAKTIICSKCGEDGHLSPNCPSINKKMTPHRMRNNQCLGTSYSCREFTTI
jgi:hypothetical protein